MHYLMITTASALFSLQFMFNDNFQKANGEGINSALNFAFYSSVVGMLLMLIINGFILEFSFFSLLLAAVMAIINIFFSYSSVKVLNKVSLSKYSMYSMLGGMLLPFLYGVIIEGDEFKVSRICCCILIIIALALTVKIDEKKSGSFKFYAMVFVLNGLTATVSGIHQSNSLAVDSESFLALSKLITILICVVMKLLMKDKNYKISIKSFLYSGGYSVFNCIGNLLLLISLLHLPISVQYPIVTGGTIVFSTIISAVKGEKIPSREVAAAGIAFLASSVMAL